MSDSPKRSDKHQLARNSLPFELVAVFDALVTDYKFAASVHHGSPFVSYVVLAEIVKAGWRLVGEPIDIWKSPKEVGNSKVIGDK